MDDLVECLPNRCADARMVVPERGADLPGGEVEDPPSPCRLHERATGPDDQLVEERSPVADQLSGARILHVPQCVSVSVDACAILGSWAIAEIVFVWIAATVVMPFGVGYVLGHGGFAAAAFAALGISTLLLSLQAGEGQVMQGMGASFLISSAPAYLGGRARGARRLRLR
jgi:hypothetical protein